MTTEWAALQANWPWINFKHIFYPVVGGPIKIVPKIVVVVFLTMLNIYRASFLQQIQHLAKQFCHQGNALPRHPQINVNIMIKKCWNFQAEKFCYRTKDNFDLQGTVVFIGTSWWGNCVVLAHRTGDNHWSKSKNFKQFNFFFFEVFCFGEVFASLYGSSFGIKQIDFKTLNSFR